VGGSDRGGEHGNQRSGDFGGQSFPRFVNRFVGSLGQHLGRESAGHPDRLWRRLGVVDALGHVLGHLLANRRYLARFCGHPEIHHGMSASLYLNTASSVSVTLRDTDGTLLQSYGTLPPGGPVNMGSFWGNAVLEVSDGTHDSFQPVYLSDASCLTVDLRGSAYNVSSTRFTDAYPTFWLGFGLYVGLWICTLFLKSVRAGVNQNVG